MTSENITKERWDQLGLPPMELAESSANNRNDNAFYKCLLPTLRKLIVMILLTVFGVGTYVLLLKIFEDYESTRNTEIIIVTGNQEIPNVTVHNMEIFLQMKNSTPKLYKERRKRHAITSTESPFDIEDPTINFNDEQMQKAREAILKHDILCNNEERQEICKDFVTKLKALTEHNDVSGASRINLKVDHDKQYIDVGKQHIDVDKQHIDVDKQHTDVDKQHIGVEKQHIGVDKQHTDVDNNTKQSDISPTDISKREALPLSNLDSILESIPSIPLESRDASPLIDPHLIPQHHLSDSCLLARLLKQNYPQAKGIYEPISEYSAPHATHYEHPFLPQNRYFSPAMHAPYLQARDIMDSQRKIHPQDVDIFMSLLTSKSDETATDRPSNVTRAAECAVGTIPCVSGDACVDEKQWCDGNVDCADVSDEARCSCKSRVNKSRLCDGYFDCPFGEDEMGCFGCNENMFSCEDLDINSQSTCFSKEQRCNNVVDCPNHKDEVECNMLAPSLLKKPLFAISNTEGFLHRNFKGDWYAVCKNPYMWAHDACRRETGLIIRPPFISIVPIDPMSKIDYLNTGPGGLIQTTDSCMNSSAVYVTCPDMLCGTRVQSTSQLLRENAAIENHLFGRNKRFLLPNHPYPLMFYGNRLKRDVDETSTKKNNEIEFDTSKKDFFETMRNKRTESRVVGGKPSQPAAWPWMVAVYRNGMFHCGGVVITHRWIISAAHCVHKFWEHYYEVQVGMLRRFSFSPQEQNHKVTHVIVNQHYSQTDMKNDLSLLRVEPAIPFSRWVRPICLPSPDTAGPDWLWGPSPGTVCTAVGWGATTEHGPDPDHMREVEVPIWENCKHQEDRSGKEICAGFVEGGKDACQGDSGGPLLCRNPFNSQQWYMAGIVSHGDGCARKDEPGVYTRVSLFIKWIKYHTTSKTLPIVQPIQKCPGFKCESGVSKCLPNKRKCDRIVDCLDGEDETKCEVTRMSLFDENIFLHPKITPEELFEIKQAQSKSVLTTISDVTHENTTSSKSFLDKGSSTSFIITTPHPRTIDSSTDNYSTKRSENVDITSTEKNLDRQLNLKELTPYAEEISTTTDNASVQNEEKRKKLVFVEDNPEHKHDLNEPKHTEKPDFEHASTLEIINYNSSESVGFSEENITADPTSTESISQSRGDSEIMTVDIFGESLESRASVLETLRESKIQKNPENHTSDFFKDDNDNNNIESTTSAFTLNGLTDSVEGEQFTTPLNIAEDKKQNTPETKAENKSNLVIELFPNSQPGEHDQNGSESKNINSEKNITLNHNHEDTSDKNPQSKDDFQDKTDTVKKIEDVLFSELEPAKLRRKHRIPIEFKCRRIEQTIPYHQRCDHKADCEDGTDELDCTCTDFLSTFDEKLICDGVVDCSDGQDESDCFTCPEDHFLCKRSQFCLPEKHVCDGKPECPLGEDELDCFALSNGKVMEFDLDERPIVNLEGYLTKKHLKEWHIVCDDKLSPEQQEQAATHICRYLGFSSANRYNVKYINLKEDEIAARSLDNNRNRRDAMERVPIHFAYRQESEDNDTARHVVIKEPQVIKEQCVPNITKTCKSLYVFCDNSLFTNFDGSDNVFLRESEAVSNHMWPWVAKVFVEGDYRCTGVLVNLSWVLVSDSCLWDSTLSHHYITVVLGSHRTLGSVNGMHEQVYQVDAKKDIYRSKASLLHLKEPAHYSNLVKPMVVSSSSSLEQKSTCVAVGQDSKNHTISVFLEETGENCHPSNRCFKRKSKENICPLDVTSHRHWAGIVSCHTEQGWYPAATFVDGRGECGLGDQINATDIENLKNEIKHHYGKKTLPSVINNVNDDDCEGVRCGRGRCIHLLQVCNGVRECEDGSDESESSCDKKYQMCDKDPYYKGCECTVGQLKCRNGRCVSKERFRDGSNDCGDGTDEPGQTICSDYLSRVMPSRLCDGVLHCHDRSDEDPMFCKCFAKRNYKCGSKSGVDHCVAPDMVCDGVRDCPNGEDEQTCIGLNAPQGTPYGTGQIIVRSHGVWHSKCYALLNFTKSELEGICSELGFNSGHAKLIKEMKNFVAHPYNNKVVDPFNEIILNNNTSIKMRNTHEPIAKAVFDNELDNCHPVFIECR